MQLMIFSHKSLSHLLIINFKKLDMRIFRFTILFLLVSVAFYASAQPRSKNENLEWKVAVTDPFMNQNNELAKVSPIIGGDTESYWAASVVDSICTVSKTKPYNYYEQVALCNLAQETMAYGMSYFTAILGTSRHKEFSDELLSTIPRIKKMYKALSDSKFTELRLITEDTHNVTIEYAMYFCLYSMVEQNDPFNCKNQVTAMISFVDEQEQIFKTVSDSIQAFRLCSVIEQSAFFITYCSMFNAFKSLEQHEKTKDSVNSIARWFDSHTMPIESELNKKSPDLSTFYMDDQAYFEFMKEATIRKVTLLGYIVEAIKNIEKEQKKASNQKDGNS